MVSEYSAVYYPDEEEKYLFEDSYLEDVKDEKLNEAYKKAKRTGRLTPLLKEELKSQINARRHSEGKPEIMIKFEKHHQHENEEKSPESRAKKAKRREQNKRASKKRRQKIKQLEPNLIMERQTLEETNKAWKAKIAQWMAQKIHLEQMLDCHECCMLLQEPVQSYSPDLDPSFSPTRDQLFFDKFYLSLDELQLPCNR